jgi:polyphosphate glucokinase
MRKAAKTKRQASRGVILTVDVGGSHVKVMTDKDRVKREFVSGPDLTPEKMVAKIKDLTKDWVYERVSLGFPGPVGRNRPLKEPHNLGTGWAGFDFAKAFGRPTRVINDALMQALGHYQGGRMLFLGLGTGLGSAMIVDDVFVPMELAHMPYRKGRTFEHYVGARGLRRLGKKRWRRRVEDAISRLVAAFGPDYVMLGGGNADKVDPLPDKVRLGRNADAFTGGFRLWERPFAGGAARDD